MIEEASCSSIQILRKELCTYAREEETGREREVKEGERGGGMEREREGGEGEERSEWEKTLNSCVSLYKASL